VFNLSIEEGLILKDGITQFESSAGLLNSDIYFSSPCYVKRDLYIDNVLATILRARNLGFRCLNYNEARAG